MPLSAPEPPPGPPVRRGPGVLLILVATALPALLLAAVAFAGGTVVLAGRAARAADLQASTDAYLGGDCAAAVRRFEAAGSDLLIGSPPVPTARQRAAAADCRTLLGVGGGDAARLRGYDKLAGAMSRTAARAALAAQVSGALGNAAVLAKKPDRPTCNALYGLRSAAVLPEQDAGLARMLLSCGNLLGAKALPVDSFRAMQFYRDLRTAKPRPAVYDEAVEAEAKLRVTRAKDDGSYFADAYAPDRKGSGKRSTVVVRNDSDTTVSVAVVGKSFFRVVELAPCTDCKAQPKDRDYDCRTSTPHTEFTLPKGTYTVAWEYEQPGSHYRLVAGRWDLTAGGRYTDCSYIVRD